MISNRTDYEGFAIETNPEEQRDGSGWAEGYIIKINRFEGRWFGSDRRFQSRDAANAASLLAAKREIDRSPSKSGQDPDQIAPVLPDDLRATWTEDENLRPTIPSATEDGGALRYTKDTRRKRLDELDGEPE